MFRLKSNFIIASFLIAATAFTGFSPAVSVCLSEDAECGTTSNSSCHECVQQPDEAKVSKEQTSQCCSQPVRVQTCCCAEGDEAPATPQNRRTSGERDSLRDKNCSSSTVLLICDSDTKTVSFEETARFTSQPMTRCQAMTCCWLI